MNFDKYAWKAATTPALLIMLINLVVIFVGPAVNQEYSAYFLLFGIFLLFISGIWIGIKVRNIKLVLVNSEKLKTANGGEMK